MSDLPLSPADERKHPPGPERLWGEAWYFDFTDRTGTLGGYVRLGLYPHLGGAWYWACLVGDGRPLVTVIDHEVPLPKGSSLEIRADGLWADHVVETPYDHMTLGAEAFAVGVEHPAEVYGSDLRGDRVPLGFDLEWETDRGGVHHQPDGGGYEIACIVHGEVLVGDEAIDFDGIGQRHHRWGVQDWWTDGWVSTAGGLDDGTRFGATVSRVAGKSPLGTGYLLPPNGAITETRAGAAREHLGPHGLPTGAQITCGPLELSVQARHLSPVHLVDVGPPPRQARLPRALCRFSTPDGRTGVGWTEWNQPGPRGTAEI